MKGLRKTFLNRGTHCRHSAVQIVHCGLKYSIITHSSPALNFIQAFTSSRIIIETLEQDVEYVQS